jgi:hypothetical protein
LKTEYKLPDIFDLEGLKYTAKEMEINFLISSGLWSNLTFLMMIDTEYVIKFTGISLFYIAFFEEPRVLARWRRRLTEHDSRSTPYPPPHRRSQRL